MYDWELSEEPDGKIVGKLCNTEVTVSPTADDTDEGWNWEVRFADGQVQTGAAADPDAALAKAKQVAERYLP